VSEPAEPGSAEPGSAEPPAPSTTRVEARIVERTGPAQRPAEALDAASEPSTPGRRRRATKPGPAPEPVVHVHIGRIEVRAPAAPAERRAPRLREPLLSLDDYLAQGHRKGR
jgi:hypothetical protein